MTILGLIEKVTVIGKRGKSRVAFARIDTGATKSSIDVNLARALTLGPVIDTTVVKSASGTESRKVIQGEILIKGKRISAKFTIADRTHMTYKVLIGQNILKTGGFLIDPTRKSI
jgi:hypothetical protein